MWWHKSPACLWKGHHSLKSCECAFVADDGGARSLASIGWWRSKLLRVEKRIFVNIFQFRSQASREEPGSKYRTFDWMMQGVHCCIYMRGIYSCIRPLLEWKFLQITWLPKVFCIVVSFTKMFSIATWWHMSTLIGKAIGFPRENAWIRLRLTKATLSDSRGGRGGTIEGTHTSLIPYAMGISRWSTLQL